MSGNDKKDAADLLWEKHNPNKTEWRCIAMEKESNVKELRIAYDGNGEQLDRVVFNGETYELRSKRACKVELICEPNERPVLRIEYVGREKG